MVGDGKGLVSFSGEACIGCQPLTEERKAHVKSGPAEGAESIIIDWMSDDSPEETVLLLQLKASTRWLYSAHNGPDDPYRTPSWTLS